MKTFLNYFKAPTKSEKGKKINEKKAAETLRPKSAFKNSSLR